MKEHIIERKLFDDGGYYLNNAASVCEHHHIECEKTLITVGEVYKAAKITEPNVLSILKLVWSMISGVILSFLILNVFPACCLKTLQFKKYLRT